LALVLLWTLLLEIQGAPRLTRAIEMIEQRQEEILAWLPLARSIAAHQFRRLGGLTRLLVIDRDDMFHTGVIGLIRAVDNFDPAHPEAQAAYFATRIRGAIFDYLRSFPYFKNGEVIERADETELEQGKVCRELEEAEKEAELNLLLMRLPFRQQTVFRESLRGTPPRLIARRLGVNQSRVSQIKKEALERLREFADEPGNPLSGKIPETESRKLQSRTVQ
jgi:RNA polymerase sigma factor (sigma-70 family)